MKDEGLPITNKFLLDFEGVCLFEYEGVNIVWWDLLVDKAIIFF